MPSLWTYSKLIVIFKKGIRATCGNYRGISINDTLYRIFYKVLYRRLEKWYKPSREQAGCQKNRGCTEQILTIRLLSEYAKKSQEKLFLLFIDFEKAYDKVPRKGLLDVLKDLGCGRKFLQILAAIYANIKMVFKLATIATSMGVRQGAATSCMLFIIYLDVMVKMINGVDDDKFLKSCHALLLMDDTVLLATSRERLIQKFKIVQEFCTMYGMSINISKTKFMVINNDMNDKIPIILGGLTVKYCSTYVYLGAFITDDASLHHSLQLHVESKMKHVLKLASFLHRNPELPFTMKKQVAEACVISSLLYGCETWLTRSYGKMLSLYMNIVKLVLGVRKTTCNDICLIESGMPSLEACIEHRRSKYFSKTIKSLQNDSILKHALDLLSTCNSPANAIINSSINSTKSLGDDKIQIAEKVRSNTNSSKRMTYLSINPLLQQPSIYHNHMIQESKRYEYSRARLSSHNLRIETGRWSRTPRENRICTCEKDIQTEEHVFLHCEVTAPIRRKFGIESFDLPNLFSMGDNIIVNFVYEVMKKMSD